MRACGSRELGLHEGRVAANSKHPHRAGVSREGGKALHSESFSWGHTCSSISAPLKLPKQHPSQLRAKRSSVRACGIHFSFIL